MSNSFIKSALALIGGLALAVGGNLLMVESWDDVTTPSGIGRLVVTSGGVLISWFGPSPSRNK